MAIVSEELTNAIYNYLHAPRVRQLWGEGTLYVKAELGKGTEADRIPATLWLSKTAPDPGQDSKSFLEGALARVRQGFESDEIQGWRGEVADAPNWTRVHDDAEIGATVQTLEIWLTVERAT